MSTSRLFSRGHKARSLGVVLLAVISVATQMVALAALSVAAPTTESNPVQATMASALLSGIGCGGVAGGSSLPGCQATATENLAGAQLIEHVELPRGGSQCPDSGAGAACGSPRLAVPDPGVASVPAGHQQCPLVGGAGPNLLGSCDPEQPSAATDPSVATTPSAYEVDLSASATTLATGNATVLQATTTLTSGSSPFAIEIFDLTTSTLVGGCMQASNCKVAYTAAAGVHAFAAYITAPTESVPDGATKSNQVMVRWLGISLAVGDPAAVGPGKPINFTATATEDVGAIGYMIEIYDLTAGARVTYCTHGTTCATALTVPEASTHTVVAALTSIARAARPTSKAIHMDSNHVTGTWLSVSLEANQTQQSSAAYIRLTATASADLSTTKWSLAIYDDRGILMGSACTSVSICTVTVPAASEDNHAFYAVIQSVPAVASTSPLVRGIIQKAPKQASADIQARSGPVKPKLLLWGVDSCKSFTQDPAGASGLYPQVVSAYHGAPDFWGRYLTNTYYCPALSAAEIAAAQTHHMGILPIYNDYDCSAVRGYQTAGGYAAAAAAAAAADGIPQGRGIAIDIEPGGDACPGADGVDPLFVQGWHDGITQRGYVPIFYANSTAYLAFAQAYCAAVGAHPEIATDSYLWSFEPSLLGAYSKPTAPRFAPNIIGCSAQHAAWQYELSSGSNPDVDQDEALSSLPLWFP